MSESRSVKTGGFGHDFRLGFRHRTDMYYRGFLSKDRWKLKHVKRLDQPVENILRTKEVRKRNNTSTSCILL
jgi:hypothetical protein